uniref:Alternative oxidase n=1 Tax=Eutreptiella gymnastica TaxID=73025 RepID=A0A7S4GJJ8_9EUGL
MYYDRDLASRPEATTSRAQWAPYVLAVGVGCALALWAQSSIPRLTASTQAVVAEANVRVQPLQMPAVQSAGVYAQGPQRLTPSVQGADLLQAPALTDHSDLLGASMHSSLPDLHKVVFGGLLLLPAAVLALWTKRQSDGPAKGMEGMESASGLTAAQPRPSSHFVMMATGIDNGQEEGGDTEKAEAEAEATEVNGAKPPKPKAVGKVKQLWVQWGLLGLTVGVIVAAAQFMGIGPEEVQTLIGGTGADLGALGGAEDVVASTVDALGGDVVDRVDIMEIAAALGVNADVLKEFIASSAETGVEFETEVLGEDVISTRLATVLLFGSVGALAGQVAESLDADDSEKGQGFDPIGLYTPGERREGTVLKGRVSLEDDRMASAVGMGFRKFSRELRELVRTAFGSNVAAPKMSELTKNLNLSNDAVWEREYSREQVPSALPVKLVYDVLCRFIDVAFDGRPIQRFWFLETVARMPYFAYMTILHLYETLGWWRSLELRTVHAAEEDNESHHLMIMESLGGDREYFDRFLAQHGAIFYYWVLVLFFLVDPRFSYNFSRLLEMHAVDTYGEFVDANAEELKKLPPPPIAVEYYRTGDLYTFDKFQTSQRGLPEDQLRRPPCATLYDVFSNIRDDELEHVKTMTACEAWITGGPSPVPLGSATISIDNYEKEVQRTDEGREAWKRWSEYVNETLRK